MNEPLKLLCVLAHPDDESLGTGGILARYAAEGVETSLVTATRGERGWQGDPRENPGMTALGAIREGELRAAAHALGIQRVELLPYIDGELDQVDPAEVIGAIAGHLRRIRPHVVVTFGPDGAYGHPDHIAISQYTTAALVAAADPDYADPHNAAPHRVAKLYYMALSADLAAAYAAVFGPIAMTFDSVVRHEVIWPDWAITTRVDARDHWETVWRAVACHQSQLPNYGRLAALTPTEHGQLWGNQCYYRALSLVNGGRQVETDLFAGLR